MAGSTALLSRKTQRALGGTLNESVVDMSCDFGRRMMAKMGWSEGKGLGKKEDGMKSHVKVKQRSELLGLGADEASALATNWAPPPELEASLGESRKTEKARKKEKKQQLKRKGGGDAVGVGARSAPLRRRHAAARGAAPDRGGGATAGRRRCARGRGRARRGSFIWT